MTPDIIVSIITVLGTMAASFGGIVVSSRLTNYRIEHPLQGLISFIRLYDLHSGIKCRFYNQIIGYYCYIFALNKPFYTKRVQENPALLKG